MAEPVWRGFYLVPSWIAVGLIVTAVQMPRAFEFVLAHRAADESWLALFLPDGWWSAVSNFIASVLDWIAGFLPGEMPLLCSRAWLLFAMMVTAVLPTAAFLLRASRRRNVLPFMLLTFSGGALSLPITAWVLVVIRWASGFGASVIAAIRELLRTAAPEIVDIAISAVIMSILGLILVVLRLLIKSVGVAKMFGVVGVLAVIGLLCWCVFSTDLLSGTLASLGPVAELGLVVIRMLVRFVLHAVGAILLPIVVLGAFLYVGYCVHSPLLGALGARRDAASFGNAMAGMGVTWSVHFSVLATGAADLPEAQHLPVWGALVEAYRFLTPDVAVDVFRQLFAGYTVGMDAAFLGVVGVLTLVSLFRIAEPWTIPARVPSVLLLTCVAVGLAMATEVNIVGGLLVLIASVRAQANNDGADPVFAST